MLYKILRTISNSSHAIQSFRSIYIDVFNSLQNMHNCIVLYSSILFPNSTDAGKSIWSTWSSYGPCDSACNKLRQRFCSHRDMQQCPSVNEYGVAQESIKCSDAECYGTTKDTSLLHQISTSVHIQLRNQ